MEAASVVIAIGPGVTSYKVGDIVAYAGFPVSTNISSREQILPAERVVPIPRSIDPIIVVVVIFGRLTAGVLVHRHFKGDRRCILFYRQIHPRECHALKHGGSTIVISIIIDGRDLWMANVGESGAVLCERGSVTKLPGHDSTYIKSMATTSSAEAALERNSSATSITRCKVIKVDAQFLESTKEEWLCHLRWHRSICGCCSCLRDRRTGLKPFAQAKSTKREQPRTHSPVVDNVTAPVTDNVGSSSGVGEGSSSEVICVGEKLDSKLFYKMDMRQPWGAFLLYGPPGSIKSYLAKDVAMEAGASFFSAATADTTSNPLQLQPQLMQPQPQMYLTMQSRTGLGGHFSEGWHTTIDPQTSAPPSASRRKDRKDQKTPEPPKVPVKLNPVKDSKVEFVVNGNFQNKEEPVVNDSDVVEKSKSEWPIEEIEMLHKNEVSYGDYKLKAGSILEIESINALQGGCEDFVKLTNLEEVKNWTTVCAKDAATKGKFRPFGLLTLASSNLTEQTAIFFQIYKSSDTFLMCSDQSRWITRFFERFGGSKNCITSRVYQTFAIGDDAHLFAFNNGRKSVLISELVLDCHRFTREKLNPIFSGVHQKGTSPVNNVKSSLEDSLPGLPENRHELPILIIVSL
ncbi:6-&1-fructan exohydrolase [Artemisia annua]|uniref:6-&1-fructan exohydrolase n=1 Tax=Artemisia annua TaxID=35608 RepID=A0A2U1MB01_ARTAN|nr:6-&1-fructan exohydrolase [Artemisia annua]